MFVYFLFCLLVLLIAVGITVIISPNIITITIIAIIEMLIHYYYNVVIIIIFNIVSTTTIYTFFNYVNNLF